MADCGNYLEEKLLGHVLGEAVFPSPAAWLALSTTPTSDSSGGTPPAGNGYARINVTGNWSVAAFSGAINSVALNFPLATGPWGTITHWAIFDASTGGNLLFHGNFNAPLLVPGGSVGVAAGAMAIGPPLDAVSEYLKVKLLNHCLNNVPFAMPSKTFVALSLADPTPNGSGLTEPGETYVRQQALDWKISDVGGGDWVGALNADINYPQVDVPWGTITHMALMDALSGGNMLFFRPLTNGPTPTVKYDVVYFQGDGAANTLRIQ